VLDKTHNILFFFLQSANSIKDQPNDNGTNAHITSVLKFEFEKFKAKFPITTIDATFLNYYVAETYASLIKPVNVSRLKTVIVKSYAKTRLHPASDRGREVVENAGKKPCLLSTLYTTSESGQSALDKHFTYDGDDSVISSSYSSSSKPHPPHPDDVVTITVNLESLSNSLELRQVKLAIPALAIPSPVLQ